MIVFIVVLPIARLIVSLITVPHTGTSNFFDRSQSTDGKIEWGFNSKQGPAAA
jgi:hypothetical protein